MNKFFAAVSWILAGVAIVLLTVVLPSHLAKQTAELKEQSAIQYQIETLTSTYSAADDDYLVISTAATKSFEADPVFAGNEWKALESLNEKYWSTKGVENLTLMNGYLEKLKPSGSKMHAEALVNHYKVGLEEGGHIATDQSKLKRAAQVITKQACESASPTEFIEKWTPESLQKVTDANLPMGHNTETVKVAFQTVVTAGVKHVCP